MRLVERLHLAIATTIITRNSFTMDCDFLGARAILDNLAATGLAAIRSLHHKR
jgi:hypothetical protein